MLGRKRKTMNLKTIYCLHREERLTIRKRDRKGELETRGDDAAAADQAALCPYFVGGALGCGRRLRVLNVIDDWSHDCLPSVVDTSISRTRVRERLFVA